VGENIVRKALRVGRNSFVLDAMNTNVSFENEIDLLFSASMPNAFPLRLKPLGKLWLLSFSFHLFTFSPFHVFTFLPFVILL
jgi:hypothetical protein